MIKLFQTSFQRLGIFLFALCLPNFTRAQFVADGHTNILSGLATNISEEVTVGTNGSFTLLVVTNGSALTNTTGSVTIGLNSSAQSNRLIITGSRWSIEKGAIVGQNGAGNELDILNGAIVTDAGGDIGFGASASNNLALVSDSGSTWEYLNAVGEAGSFNTLIVSNGARVFSSLGNNYIGESGSGNRAIITGSGSLWTCSGSLLVGGNFTPGMNRLTVNNGAQLSCSTCDIGDIANSNLLTVADSGSSLQCQSFLIGNESTNNQCVVSNGAKLTATLATLSQPNIIEGTFTRAVVTGPGSLWTNAGDLEFGQYSNVLSVTSGGTLVDDDGYVEPGYGKPNEVIISGPNSLWKNIGGFSVSDSSSQLFITNGGTLMDYQATFAATNCFAVIAGPGSLWTNQTDFYLGYYSGTNRLVVTDSGKLTAPTIWVGYSTSGDQLVVSNSGLVQANSLGIGSSSSSSNSVTLAGGTIVATNTTVTGTGNLVINSGLMNTTGLGVTYSGNVIFNGGTLQLGSAAWFNNTVPFAIGDGTDAATLQIWDYAGHLFGDGLFISSNAVLSGTGTITANISVNNGGTIAPGTTNLGTIVDNGALILNPGSTALMKLNASATASDTLTGMSNLVYSGALQLTNISGSFSGGQSFSLFAATNYSGAFATLTPASPGPGLRWDTYELGVNGVLRVFSTTTPAPSFGGITAASGNLLISASGGIPYDPCYLLTSTNLAAPVSGWTCITTNFFDSTGATTFTNAIPTDSAQQYFRLQVN